MISVEVRSLSGQVLHAVRLPAASTVGVLRSALMDAQILGASIAELSIGSSTLEDTDKLHEVCGGSDTVTVALVRKPLTHILSSGKFEEGEEEAEQEEFQAFVIDTGSGTTCGGWAGDDRPRAFFPSVVGRDIAAGMDACVGDQAILEQKQLELTHPVQHGLVTNWDDLEMLWHHCYYNELILAPEDHPMLVIEAPLNPKADREKITQIMFETFNVPGLFIASHSFLALHGSGLTTGVVVESMFDSSRAVPIYEGYILMHAVAELQLGGHDLTKYLATMMRDGGRCPDAISYEFACKLKESHCYVALDFQAELALASQDNYAEYVDQGPKGEILATIGSERFRCPEALFEPSVLGTATDGIHIQVRNSIAKCDSTLHEALCSSIVLSGGSTMFRGMGERLTKELNTLLLGQRTVHVISPSSRQFSAWIGASMLASSKGFMKICIRKSDYDEVGPEIVHSRCPFA